MGYGSGKHGMRTYQPQAWTRTLRGRVVKYSRGIAFAKSRTGAFTAAPVLIRKAQNLGLKNVRTGGLLGVEVKFHDSALVGQGLTAPADCSGGEADPAVILCLNGVPQGDTAITRDGQKIAMKSIEIEGIIACPAQTNQTAAEYAPHIFIALVLDTQTNAAQLNSEDVFSNSGANAILATFPLRNFNYTERFKVLKRWCFKMPVPAITYDGTNIEQSGVQAKFKCFKNLKGLVTKFTNTATTGVIGTVMDNSLHLIAYCNDTGMAPSISYNSRLRFVG